MKMRRAKIVGCLCPIAVLLAAASTVHAHLRWFVEPSGAADVHYSLDTINVFIVLGALLYCGLAAWIHRRTTSMPAKPLSRLLGMSEESCWRIIAVLASLMLLDNVLRGVFLAPNLVLAGPTMARIGAGAQLTLSAILFLQLSFSISGVLIIVAGIIAALFFSPFLLIDYVFEFTFLALALFLIGPRLNPIDRSIFRWLRIDAERWQHLPLPMIRIGLGLSLAVLAVHNKLSSPALSVSFLSEHDFNFVRMMGFSGFTDLHFAFAAGVAELTFGVLLIAGLATRFVTATMSIFFVATLLALGALELSGHAPIFGIVLLLITHGSGSCRRT